MTTKKTPTKPKQTRRLFNVKKSNSPARQHVRFMKLAERQAILAYKKVMRKIVTEIEENLRAEEKLTKSVETGWTGETPKIQVNLATSVTNVLGKYLPALRWLMVGDYADKEAKESAKLAGLYGNFVPGVVQSAYLDALDFHSNYYKQITGQTPQNIPKDILQSSLENIASRSSRYWQKLENQIEIDILNAVDQIIDNLNSSIEQKVYNKVSPDISQKEYEEILESVDTKIPTTRLKTDMKKVTQNLQHKWETTVRGEIGTASAVGTHQSLKEVFGANTEHGDSVDVVWLTSKDDKVCNYCQYHSTHPDGSFKRYKMSDFKPAGWNIGKKRQDWGLVIPPAHVNCRCTLVYVPPGFDVQADGQITPQS